MNTPPLRQRLKSAAKLILAMGVGGPFIIAVMSGYQPAVSVFMFALVLLVPIAMVILVAGDHDH